MSLCLRQELEAFNVGVYTIHPGRILTSSGASDAHLTAEEAASRMCKWIDEESDKEIEGFVEPYERYWGW